MAAASPVEFHGNLLPGGNVSLNLASIAAASSPDASSIPTSASSPASDASTPSSTTSTAVPKIAIRPNTDTRPGPIKTSGIANSPNIMAAHSPSPMSAGPPMSMTSKEWVIPPRPKPGRKPATDTPPTKRKAQNRAAQRAFRERRAARVGELEEQLDEQKEEHDRTVSELQDRIMNLENETQILQSRCQWLEKSLQEERQRGDAMAKNWENAQQQLAAARTDSIVSIDSLTQHNPSRTSHHQNTQSTPGRPITDSAMLAEPRGTTQPFSISQIISPPEEPSEGLDFTCGSCQANGPCVCAEEALQTTGFGCGRCTVDSRCECLEESIRASMSVDLKRPFPPSSPSSKEPSEKRQRSDTVVSNMETDFTSLFSSARKQSISNSAISAPQIQTQPLASVEPRDSCGFCKDGTYCFCADSSAVLASFAQPATQPVAQQTHTPPPSENDVVPMPMEVTATGAIKLPSFRSMRQGRAGPSAPAPAPVPAPSASQPARTGGGGCGPNGPGTCAQCLADPKSGLFCRSLAANINRQQQSDGDSSSSGGCCGSGGPGGCCKAGKPSPDAQIGESRTSAIPAPTATAAATTKPDAGFGVSISCAEAYQTLASHRNFNDAADDIGSWLPKLRAAPIPDNIRMGTGRGGGQAHINGRWAPIEVEAASIMAVLKDFDVRFGRGQ